MRDIDLAWLAGIFDGEGNIGFEVRSKEGSCINVRATVTNTDELLINKVLSIYGGLGINSYCQKRKRHSNDGHIRKPCYDLQVHRLREVKILLEAILPFLTTKKERALLAVEYCDIRINKRDKVTANRFAKYGDEERSIVAKVHRLNIRNNRLRISL